MYRLPHTTFSAQESASHKLLTKGTQALTDSELLSTLTGSRELSTGFAESFWDPARTGKSRDCRNGPDRRDQPGNCLPYRVRLRTRQTQSPGPALPNPLHPLRGHRCLYASPPRRRPTRDLLCPLPQPKSRADCRRSPVHWWRILRHRRPQSRFQKKPSTTSAVPSSLSTTTSLAPSNPARQTSASPASCKKAESCWTSRCWII